MDLERTLKLKLEEASFAGSTRLFRGQRKNWTGRSKRDKRNKNQPEEDNYKIWVPFNGFFSCDLCFGRYKCWNEHVKECPFKGVAPPPNANYFCKKCKIWDDIFKHQCPQTWEPKEWPGTPRDWSDELDSIDLTEGPGFICGCGTLFFSKWTTCCSGCSREKNKRKQRQPKSLREIKEKVLLKMHIKFKRQSRPRSRLVHQQKGKCNA